MARRGVLLAGMALALAALGAVLYLRSDAPPPRSHFAATEASSSVRAAGHLWVLAIGVSRYRNRALDLRFAAADAQAVADALAAQANTPLYEQVHSLVLLDDEVSRESILSAVSEFLGRAAPDDAVVLFLAGHGIQDPNTGSYYFLPHDAGRQDFITSGVRMSDLDESLQLLRRNVRRVVVLLDTCHAGALQLAGADLHSAGEAAAGEFSDGFFLLAAARPQEASREILELGHGAFTWALLEALRGEADADGDSQVSVAELFAAVGHTVARRTGEHQHPYQRIEGSDAPFAVVLGDEANGTPRPTPARQAMATAIPNAASIAVTRFTNLRAGPEHDWIGMALLSAFNTELTRATSVQVYAPELIGSERTMRADDLTAARRLGIAKVLTGTYSVFGDGIRIDARVIDSASGLQEASTSAEGRLADFFALQRQIVTDLRGAYPALFPSPPPATPAAVLEEPLNAYKLLLQAEGLTGEASPVPATPTAAPAVGPQSLRWPRLVSEAFAQPPAVVPTDVDRLLERYRTALERGDVDAYAAVYASFSPNQRSAIRAYFDNARELRVQIRKVELSDDGSGPVLSFVRADDFLDRESGRRAQLEVRLIKALVRSNGEWKFAAPAE